MEQHGGTEVLFAVPPVGGARGGAAGAEDAFVEAVELFAVGGGLAVFEALGIALVNGGGEWCQGNDVHLRSWSRAGGRA